MKTLLLLRHAKSSWKEAGVDDHERPLSPRGQRAAEVVAAYLAQREEPPSLALCSTARRALETLEPIRRRLGLPFSAERELYLAEPAALLDRLARLDERERSVLVVGHNPGLHELGLQLASGGDGEALARLRERFPTAALARLALPIERWEQLAPRCATLLELTLPKDLV